MSHEKLLAIIYAVCARRQSYDPAKICTRLVVVVSAVSIAFQRPRKRCHRSYRIRPQTLRDKAEQNHDFGYDLIKRVSKLLLQRLQETRLLLVDFCGFSR
jgi:hypothetical protein